MEPSFSQGRIGRSQRIRIFTVWRKRKVPIGTHLQHIQARADRLLLLLLPDLPGVQYPRLLKGTPSSLGWDQICLNSSNILQWPLVSYHSHDAFWQRFLPLIFKSMLGGEMKCVWICLPLMLVWGSLTQAAFWNHSSQRGRPTAPLIHREGRGGTHMPKWFRLGSELCRTPGRGIHSSMSGL